MATKKTVKFTRRVNSKSPKYNYGFHRINTGWRIDVPFHSVSVFTGGSNGRETVRSNMTGLRFIFEDNRSKKLRVLHNVNA